MNRHESQAQVASNDGKPQRRPEPPRVTIANVSNVWSLQMWFVHAGDIELGHRHHFDHVTLLAKGALRVTVEGKTKDYDAAKGGRMILILKDELHKLEALKDDTLAFCIHALRGDNKTGDILDPSMLPAGCNPLQSGIAAPLTYDLPGDWS